MRSGRQLGQIAMAKAKARISITSVLDEIDAVLETSKYYQSRESGKRFYDPKNFPSKLTAFVAQSGQTVRQNAQRFGMSVKTLKSIMSGGPLSENMLNRVRSRLVIESKSSEQSAIFPGDWRSATPAKVSSAIADVSNKLVFLKKVIEGSNFLHSEDSPIDKIQVLQLIALLTATLEALRAPLIDKKQASGFFRWLSKLAQNSAKKGVEKIVVDAMEDAVNAGTDLIHHLSNHAGIADLGKLIT